MNQNSDKKRKKKKIFVYYLGKRMTLHYFLRKKATLKKFGRSEPASNGRLRIPILNRPLRLPRGHLPKRPGGHTMQDGLKTLPGKRVIVNFDSVGTTTTTIQSVVALNDLLSNVLSVRGDFKHPNPQRFTHLVYSDYSGLVQTINSNSAHTYGGQTSGSAIYPNPGRAWKSFPDTTTYNKALSRLYDKIRGDLDVSIDLAESHKTKSMLRDTVRAMGNLALTFRKMKRSNPRDWGNLWLEYTYGWKPLASSIYGTVSKLLGPSSQGPGFLRATSSASESVQRGSTSSQWSTYNGIVETHSYYQTARCRFDVRYQINSTVLASLGGYTSLNPVSIAWELTPYSFVVDWFVNIGGYLRNFETACLYRSTFFNGYFVESSLGEDFAVIGGGNTVTSFGTTTSTIVNVSAHMRQTQKSRTLLSSSVYPRVPKFDPHLGASRLISGAALLGQMLTSLEHKRSDFLRSPSLSQKARLRAADRAFETASKSFSNWEREIRRKNPIRLPSQKTFDSSSFIP